MPAYYRFRERRIDEQGTTTAYYEPTPHAQGAWNPNEQHMAPATGIICRELELFAPRNDMRVARINLDIWGMILFAPFTVETRMLRVGRTIELVEIRLIAEGKTCIVAHAWRLQTCDSSSIAGLEDPPVAPVTSMQEWAGMKIWGGGYINSMQFKADAQRRPGSGVVWMKNNLQMVEEEQTSAFVRLMGMIDTANGTVTRIQPGEWAFPNVDLNISLLRAPQGEWLGLDTVQQYGTDGIGITSSVLHDEQGVFGRSEQTLTLRRIQ